jgi:hypothetical protein
MARAAWLSLGLAAATACTLFVDTRGLTDGLTDASPTANLDAAPDAPVAPPPADGQTTSEDVGAADYAAVVLADHPLAYYRFEERAGAPMAADAAGAHPASVVTPVTFGVPGAVGSAVRFDGSGYLDLGEVFDFDGLVPYTFEAWVLTAPRAADQTILVKRGGNPLLGYIFYVHDVSLTIHHEFWGTDLSAWTDTSLPSGFVHVVLTASYDMGKGNAALYVNGQRSPHGGWDNTTPASKTTYPLLIGPGFVGTIDEVAIYGTSLPATRIAAHLHAAGR